MSNTHNTTHTADVHTPVMDRQKAAAERLETRRKASIKALKACVRQLGMDDAAYRAMLLARTGHASATQCTVEQLGTLVAHLKRSGATPPAQAGKGVHADGRRRSAPNADRAPLMSKVVALLQELGRVTGNPHTMSYADAICNRNGWCTRVDFADPVVLHRLVGALERTLRYRTQAANRAA
jgi:phage gp16-like protein